MIKNRILFITIIISLIFCGSMSVFAEEEIWKLLEKGRQLYEKGDFGAASRTFRSILEQEPDNADAEVWLAKLFVNEGEYLLAEKQYLKALENKNNLYILENYTEVMYSLSDIYNKTDQYSKYEKILTSLIEESRTEGDLNLQYAINNKLRNEGVDKTFELYRYEESRYNRARRELGIFFYRTGRYTEAENNLVFPFISVLTTGYNYIYDRTANYEYTDINSHLKQMSDYPELADYIKENQLYATMYYLAAAYYADGFTDAAMEIWEIIIVNDEPESQWYVKSSRQLKSPFIEPIIRDRS